MITLPMYSLRFEPISQYRLWGGRRLAELLTAPLPGDGPIGEAWLLSDRDDHQSKVADGSLKGSTIRQFLEPSPDQLLGKLAGRFRRFTVPLTFLDANEKLSVQVHPTDVQSDYIPAGETGKSEAWVVLASIVGDGQLEHTGATYPMGRGDVVFLPAKVGACSYRPRDTVTLLDVALPE
jgi:mannose-6-phosphate isomerase